MFPPVDGRSHVEPDSPLASGGLFTGAEKLPVVCHGAGFEKGRPLAPTKSPLCSFERENSANSRRRWRFDALRKRAAANPATNIPP